MEHYDIRLRGRSSVGKQNIRKFGSIWTVVGTSGPGVLMVSPRNVPTYTRAMRAIDDPMFFIESDLQQHPEFADPS